MGCCALVEHIWEHAGRVWTRISQFNPLQSSSIKGLLLTHCLISVGVVQEMATLSNWKMCCVPSGGATAIVYEAYDNVNKTQTALKVIACCY